MEMRLAAAFAALAIPAFGLNAQEVTYVLPRTSFRIEVEAVQEQFFAGPYASFAEKLLNMVVDERDNTTTMLTSARIIPSVEADPSEVYTCDPENASFLSLSSQGLVSLRDKVDGDDGRWRFPTRGSHSFNSALVTEPDKPEIRIEYQEVQTDTGAVTIPIEHKVLVEKTLEDKATDAADMILQLRRERHDIVSGNTDANYYGNSMEVALRELDRMEREYRALFEGYTEKKTFRSSFEVIPVRGGNQKYLAFRLRDDGFTDTGSSGTPYYLELEPEEPEGPEDTAPQKKGKVVTISYRIPAVCRVKLTREGVPLVSTRALVYQLGKESMLIQNIK